MSREAFRLLWRTGSSPHSPSGNVQTAEIATSLV
jgi:hypothetical protein